MLHTLLTFDITPDDVAAPLPRFFAIIFLIADTRLRRYDNFVTTPCATPRYFAATMSLSPRHIGFTLAATPIDATYAPIAD